MDHPLYERRAGYGETVVAARHRKARSPIVAAFAVALTLGACAPVPRPAKLPYIRDRYVAMGSSFAAGPGIAAMANAADRCGRSTENYAHQLARRRGLRLIDVSCSGATTAHVLRAWNELPPQLNALDANTALVTITIGGNDIDYVGGLMWGACGRSPSAGRDARCRPVPAPTEQQWRALGDSMRRIVAGARKRAPSARIVLVDYLTVLPPAGTCADIVMTADAAEASRAVARRLAALTLEVGRRRHVEVLQASRLSAGHDACAAAAWTSGFPHPGGPPVAVPFHPNGVGMTAVAQALDERLSR